MPKTTELTSLEAFQSKTREAQDLAAAAAKEIRDYAKEYLDELKRLSFEYQRLTGKSLPEAQVLFKGGSTVGNGKSAVQKNPRNRKSLGGEYEGMTLPNAVVAVLKEHKGGAKAGDIAEVIGGQRASIAVTLSNMAKEGKIQRVGRGLYASA